SRHGFRDWLIIFLMYRHGLRVSELCRAKIEDFDETNRRMWIARLKGSLSVWHPLPTDELRAIRKWLRARPHSSFPEICVSERGEPFTRQAISYIVRRAGER
ncbi:MAG: tyrosine-type recombinase/integrase, partial [Gammaproteobacteria bacterium]|nr:tyrosine-type recombinase/integrase [Gammaproteobacteria bacterium]